LYVQGKEFDTYNKLLFHLTLCVPSVLKTFKVNVIFFQGKIANKSYTSQEGYLNTKPQQ